MCQKGNSLCVKKEIVFDRMQTNDEASFLMVSVITQPHCTFQL
jgi:hypothetical protein